MTLALTPSPDPSVAKPADAERLHVLVVEDDDGARVALRMLLELRGYAVDEASDGAAAVERALAHRPAVALIDIGLPGRDGYEVARQIRDSLAGTPMLLVALTGYQELDQPPASVGASVFDAHLVKPLKFEQFFDLLEQVAAPRDRPA